MRSTRGRRPARSVPMFAVVCLVAAVAVVAAPADSEPTGPKQRIERELESARKLIVNAHMKISRGIGGVGRPGRGGEDPTPAQACCSGNLSRIEQAMKKIHTAMDELEICYELEADSRGQLVLALVAERRTSLINTLAMFEKARQPGDVAGTVEGAKRAFRNLKQEIDNLPGCPAEDTSE